MSLFLGKHEVKYLGMKGHGVCNLLSSSLGEREEKKNFESETNQSKKKKEFISGNVKWFSSSGNQYGDSLKNWK